MGLPFGLRGEYPLRTSLPWEKTHLALRVWQVLILKRCVGLLRRLAPPELQEEFLALGRELRIRTRHLRDSARAARLVICEGPVRLELGCGKRALEGWIGVDWSPYAELQLDLRRRLPFPDASVDAIYSSHLLEHFCFPGSLMGLLTECYRVLKPEGRFDAAVPNGGRYLRAYASGSQILHDLDKRGLEPIHLSSAIDEVNWFVYMAGSHQYLFDEENIVRRLHEAGFSIVHLRPYDPALDLPERRHESLYVSARK